ncbi:hypothetical protein [Ferrimonas balearica]|uniref:hypothetical protein n=1 Tax=Ferrimonas balearica TaxID=44012 RepID=UPI001F34414B|nr:hypothetical protein [Ferrimonas balearica]MBY6094676.1 hypothetical protein [Ferrimonas balearica]
MSSKKGKSAAINKRFSPADTLSIIFSRPQMFMRLIREADNNRETGNRMGYSQTRYEMYLKDFLATDGADDKARFMAAMSLENLSQAGLLVEHDKGKSRLVFADAFIELMRQCDPNLIRELTSVEYRGFLEEAHRLSRLLGKNAHVTSGDEYYQDVRYSFFQHLLRIRSAIRTNATKFHTISEKLAELSENIVSSDRLFAHKKREMYGQASRIYERHVKPTVEFLNEAVHVPGGNLFETLASVQAVFKRRGEFEHAGELQRVALNLSNNYKKLEVTAETIRHFLSITRENALAFNAFEAINEAMEEITDTVKGRSLRAKSLANSRDITELFDFYQGAEGTKALKLQSSLVFSESQTYYDALRADIDQMLAAHGVAVDLELVDRDWEDAVDGKRIKKAMSDLQRAKLLVKLLDEMEFRPTKDLYGLLHDRLSTLLPGYSFFDLNVAMRGITKATDGKTVVIEPTAHTKLIELDGRTYRYNIRHLLETN